MTRTPLEALEELDTLARIWIGGRCIGAEQQEAHAEVSSLVAIIKQAIPPDVEYIVEWRTPGNLHREEFGYIEQAVACAAGVDPADEYECKIAHPAGPEFDDLVKQERARIVAEKVKRERGYAIEDAQRKIAKERQRLAMLENHQALTDLSHSTIADLEARIARLAAEQAADMESVVDIFHVAKSPEQE